MKNMLITLTPAESKRLIAKGIIATVEFKEAFANGYVCITLGTTTSYIVEEILEDYDKTKHVAGVVVPRGVWVTKKESRHSDAIFYKGEYMEGKKVADVLSDLGPGDMIIKGANALDADMVPLVLLASDTAGTVGSFIGAVAAKNIILVMAVGLEKCIPTRYGEMKSAFGMHDWDYAVGTPVGVMPVHVGEVFTETDALAVLFNVDSVAIAAGGVNGAEGSVTLYVVGEDEDIDAAHEFLTTQIKGEEPFPTIEDLK
ncbi:MAG: hypothetical protein HXY34_00080 [Candidatus Thorarchaeota archaeon]|nr:hypothetical protein [Candidatus Thorarchaeota archaeon]